MTSFREDDSMNDAGCPQHVSNRSHRTEVMPAVVLLLLLSAPMLGAQQRAAGTPDGTMSFYDLEARTLNGAPADLSQYRGTVSLVVNLASYCGYTPQYAGLEQLHRELHGRGFNVLGFPSNDFGGQEPGSAQEIADFCRLTYDVTFPMFEKVVTRPGADQSPVYAFLGRSSKLPAWNFGTHLVDRRGRVVAFFPSEIAPENPALRAAILEALTRK